MPRMYPSTAMSSPTGAIAGRYTLATMGALAAPPTFAIVSNRPDDVPDSYQRYLVHGFREAWPFSGSPLRLKFTRRGSKR